MILTVLAVVFVLVAVTAGSFFAGRKYGEEFEAKALALELNTFARIKSEYAVVVNDIKIRERAVLTRIKKYL